MDEQPGYQLDPESDPLPPAPVQSGAAPGDGDMSAPPVISSAPVESGIRCITCGHDLSGTALGSLCPECGAPVTRSLGTGAVVTSGKAVAALVLGICSLVMLCGCLPLSPILGGIGLIYGLIARGDIKRGAVSSASSGLNVAGLVTSIIGIVGGGLVMLAMMAMTLFG